MSNFSNRELLRALVKGDISFLNQAFSSCLTAQKRTDKENWNFLHQAFVNPNLKVPLESIVFLLNAGVSANEIDIYGNTPLHYAARAKNSHAIREMIAHDADARILNKDGRSALIESLQQHPFDPEVVKMLLSHGGIPTIDGDINRVLNYVRSISHGDNSWLFPLFSDHFKRA